MEAIISFEGLSGFDWFLLPMSFRFSEAVPGVLERFSKIRLRPSYVSRSGRWRQCDSEAASFRCCGH